MPPQSRETIPLIIKKIRRFFFPSPVAVKFIRIISSWDNFEIGEHVKDPLKKKIFVTFNSFRY
jgi:hypothetical protein